MQRPARCPDQRAGFCSMGLPRYMRPPETINNARNLVLSNTKLVRNPHLSLATFVTPTDLYDFFGDEFVHTMGFSASTSSFSAGISIIVRNRSKPEMRRVNARSIISIGTVMQDAHSFWNCAVMDKPGYDVCADCFSTSPAVHDLSVAPFISISSPDPAGVCNANMFPESKYDRCGAVPLSKDRVWVKWNYSVRSAIITLHSKLSLLCQALGQFTAAGASLLYVTTNNLSTQ
jgi:hypothetical protein